MVARTSLSVSNADPDDPAPRDPPPVGPDAGGARRMRLAAHAAALVALLTSGLMLGRLLHHPNPSGLAFLLLVVVIFAVLLGWLYRPGGVAALTRAAPRAETGRPAAPTVPAPPSAPATPAALEAPAPPAAQEERPTAPPRSPRVGRARHRPPLRATGVITAAVVLVGLTLVVWPHSHKAHTTSQGSAAPASTAPAPTPSSTPSARPHRETQPRTHTPARAHRPTAPRPAPAKRHARHAPRPHGRDLSPATLRPGMRGASVRVLQQLLRVRATGRFDHATEVAVRRFQKAHKLPATGVVATLTHAALRRAYR